MGRMYIPSTPASRGEVEPEEEKFAMSVDELRAAADELGFDLVEREEVADEHEPAGNAKVEEWVAYARMKGATDEDLTDDDGKPLGQKALREKYGTPPAS